MTNYISETYYRVKMATGSGYLPCKYDTYKEAYNALCEAYIKERMLGYEPTLFKIIRHQETSYKDSNGEHFSSCIKEVWN